MMSKHKSRENPLRIIMDSNALFVPARFKIEIFKELERLLNANFEPVLLSPILRELQMLSREGSPKMRKDAGLALRITEKCKLTEVNKYSLWSPDDVIVKVASEWNCPVFTNDRQLKKRLRDINVPVIYVRQKSQLEIEGRPTIPV